MSATDAARAVSRLIAAFRKDDIPEDTAAVYLEKLADIEPQLLLATVDRLISTKTFFPAIAEIRRAAAGIAGLLPPSPAEAMAIVRRADKAVPVIRRDGTLAYIEKYWEWPEDLAPGARKAIESVLEKCGEPSNLEGKPHFGWEVGFQKTYEAVSETLEAAALADLSVALLPGAEVKRLT